MSYKNLFVNTLQTIIPDLIDEHGKFKDFFHLAQDKNSWDQRLRQYKDLLSSTQNINENPSLWIPLPYSLSWLSYVAVCLRVRLSHR